jgi:hypothetical protein
MQDEKFIEVPIVTNWKNENIVAYFQATIAGGYAQRVRIVNNERVFKEVTGETPGANQSEFGKQFLNNKQNVGKNQCQQQYKFKVLIEHNKGSGWEPGEMKCEKVKISDNAAFGIVISDDKWPGDTDFNDCVVIISLYKGNE